MSELAPSSEKPDLTDPAAPLDPALKRRLFVGLSAGAAAIGGTFAPALAADALGKPHPPFVAEDDPAIVVAHDTLSYDGRSLPAYTALPKGPPRGAVVVVQAIWGVDAQLRDVVRRFAKEGYAAIAPELYAGLDAPSGDGATDYAPFAAVAAKLADATVDGDVRAAAQWAKAPPAIARSVPQPLKVAVTGFCMGGGITLRQTVDNADVLAAAAMWYGKVRYSTSNNNNGPITSIALAYADNVGVPLLGSFGGRDTSILPADVLALDGRLKTPHDLKVYDEAGHAFFDDTRPSYVASAASDGWARTLAWFARYLG